MMAPPPAAPGRVFISYRREETAYAAGWLFDRLADHLGRDQVFKDVDSIQLGDDFVEVITRAVGSCDVLLALIGDEWLTITDEHGRRRLDNPEDFVRLEIEAALTRKVRVIPILVDEARMPRTDELPDSLARLVRRQALELSPSRFDFDTSQLLTVLDRTLAEVQAQPAAVAAPAPPELALSATVVDLGRLRLHGPSPERRVRLGNAGGGTLNAQATTQASWLQLRRVGDEVVVAVDTTAVGEHEGTVTVDSDGGSATIRVLARVDPASSPAASATDRGAAADKAPQQAPGEAAPSQLVATPGPSLARDPRGTQDAPRGPEPPAPPAPVLPREERAHGKPRLPKWRGPPSRIISATAVLVIIVIVALIVLAQRHNPNVTTIPVEARPANVAVGEGAVWVANTRHGTVSRIDPATRKVTTIKVGLRP
jgi:YVTN family beta-propeller protein